MWNPASGDIDNLASLPDGQTYCSVSWGDGDYLAVGSDSGLVEVRLHTAFLPAFLEFLRSFPVTCALTYLCTNYMRLFLMMLARFLNLEFK